MLDGVCGVDGGWVDRLDGGGVEYQANILQDIVLQLRLIRLATMSAHRSYDFHIRGRIRRVREKDTSYIR